MCSADSDFKGSIKGIIDNINGTVKEIEGLVVDIKTKQGTVGRLFYDDSIYRKTDELLADLKQNPWKLLYKPKEKLDRDSDQ